MTDERCVSCGMSMTRDEDHAAADPSRDYCRFCAREDGSMQSFDEKLDSLTLFLVQREGLALDAAEQKARAELALLPAWKDATR